MHTWPMKLYHALVRSPEGWHSISDGLYESEERAVQDLGKNFLKLLSFPGIYVDDKSEDEIEWPFSVWKTKLS